MVTTILPNSSDGDKDFKVFRIPLGSGSYIEVENRRRSGPALTIGQSGAAASVDVSVPQLVELIDALAALAMA